MGLSRVGESGLVCGEEARVRLIVADSLSKMTPVTSSFKQQIFEFCLLSGNSMNVESMDMDHH